MISYLLDDIKDLTNLRSLVMQHRLLSIKENLCKLLKDVGYMRYCAVMEYKLPVDIQTKIVKKAYQLKNISIINEQQKRRHAVICELNGRMEYYPFNPPLKITSLNRFYYEIINKSERIIEVSKYCFKAEGDYVMGVYNLDVERSATLCQFNYFCERLKDHLMNDNMNLLIFPMEKQQLFQTTPINAFRVLYHLYLARDRYLKIANSRKLNEQEYVKSIIEFMYNRGHNIRSVRNTTNAMIFYST